MTPYAPGPGLGPLYAPGPGLGPMYAPGPGLGPLYAPGPGLGPLYAPGQGLGPLYVPLFASLEDVLGPQSTAVTMVLRLLQESLLMRTGLTHAHMQVQDLP